MLEVTNHSHPRVGLCGLLKNYNAKFVSPLLKTTNILLEKQGLVVVTGVSNGGVEASLLGRITLTTSKPWWLCMPNTFFCNIFTREITCCGERININSPDLSGSISQESCVAKSSFKSFVLESCIDLGIPMADIDNSFSSISPSQSLSFSVVANAIHSKILMKQ